MPSKKARSKKPTDPVPAPTSVELFRRAAVLHKEKKFSEAEALLREAIERYPKDADLHNARGVMLAALGRPLDASWCYRDALTYNPRGPGIWTNLGNALTQLKYLKTAVDCHQRAIALSRKSDGLLYHNLGTSLAEAGQHGEAISAFTRALEYDPDHHMARWDRARSYLHLGNYGQGWVDYDVRLISGQIPIKRLTGEKWDGRPYAGKRLVLMVEQGFGDTLWVARYLPRVKALGGELIIECQPQLLPLIESMQVADQIIPSGTPLPESDLHCFLCSLPRLFTNDFASIPRAPYLSVPRERLTKLQPSFKDAGRRLKVGIVWSGSVTFGKNHERAQPILPFFQAFALPGVQLYSLQKGPREQELTLLPRGGPIINLAPHLNDFADTAAAVAHLDLVIMTDSAVAHLAAALGKPVWLLLGYKAHWLWLLDRTDSPWYPSIRLFRPRAEGDWNHVFDSASVALLNMLKVV